MAIAVRSVKAGMTRFGYLRSRLKDGAKLGCWGQRLAPQLGRLHGVHVDFSALGVRNLNCSHVDFSALGVRNLNCAHVNCSALGVRNLSS